MINAKVMRGFYDNDESNQEESLILEKNEYKEDFNSVLSLEG